NRKRLLGRPLLRAALPLLPGWLLLGRFTTHLLRLHRLPAAGRKRHHGHQHASQRHLQRTESHPYPPPHSMIFLACASIPTHTLSALPMSSDVATLHQKQSARAFTPANRPILPAINRPRRTPQRGSTVAAR